MNLSDFSADCHRISPHPSQGRHSSILCSEADLQEFLDLLFLVFNYIPPGKLTRDHNGSKEKIVNFTVISPSALSEIFYWSCLAAAIGKRSIARWNVSRKGFTEVMAMLRTQRDKVMSYFPSRLITG